MTTEHHDDNKNPKDFEWDEEEWLEYCRKKGVYNGPPGGPPGLRRDEPTDVKKAKRFRELCNKYIDAYPDKPINIIWSMALESEKEPFIRGPVASKEALKIMETEFN
jgi:hypothetical protein